MSYIYKVTNRINGKMYIGQHRYDGVGLDPRYFGSGVLLKKAYDKYGIENFDMELVEECPEEDLNPLEQLYIEHYNTLKPNGYNLTEGGEGVSGFKLSPETIEKLSIPINQYDDNGNLVKSYISATEAARQFGCDNSAINNALRNPNIKSNGFRFRYASECSSKIEPYSKPKRYNQKKINQYSLDGKYLNTFESASEVGRILNKKDISLICACCRGKTKSAYGFIWRYYDECYGNNDITPYEKPKAYNRRKINQYSIDGEYIKTWDCMLDIENLYGYSAANICACCKGKKTTAYGFKWEYTETKKAA